MSVYFNEFEQPAGGGITNLYRDKSQNPAPVFQCPIGIHSVRVREGEPDTIEVYVVSNNSEVVAYTGFDALAALGNAFGTVDAFELVTYLTQNGFFRSAPTVSGAVSGLFFYENTTLNQPFAKDVWHDMPNNKLGPHTDLAHAPLGVPDILDPATGYILPSGYNGSGGLTIGTYLLITMHLGGVPDFDNAELDYRLSYGNGVVTRPNRFPRLDDGAGREYIMTDTTMMYIDTNGTLTNPIKLQVKCTSDFTLNNYSLLIELLTSQ